MKKMNYPSRLLKIESGQQFSSDQVSLFESDTNYKKTLAEKVDKAITQIIDLNENSDGMTYSIELPKGISHNIGDEIKSKVVKELTAYEVRIFTSIVALAQLAKARSELFYLEKINRAYFEVTLTQIFKLMGIAAGRGKKDGDLVKKSLLSLQSKKFIYHEDEQFIVSPLVQIHGYGTEKNIWDTSLKITVDSCFFDFAKSKKHTYFLLPFDINKRLREVNKGRPNVSVELLVKYLYQSKHCSNVSTVEYSHSRLVDIMNLSRYIKNKNYPRIKAAIKKGFETAKAIDLIEKVEESKNMFDELKYVIHFK
ncbi:MAG: hypothetical protein KTR26_17525 [Flammeovirgaceae bacterium]|nr:hypothetical protein [Flammeovirgaceae bacterium]